MFPGIPSYLKKDLVSFWFAHFPFQRLPSVDPRTCLHSAAEARGHWRDSHTQQNLVWASAWLFMSLISPSISFIQLIDWRMCLFNNDWKAHHAVGTGRRGVNLLLRVIGIDTWETQQMAPRMAFSSHPCGCELQACGTGHCHLLSRCTGHWDSGSGFFSRQDPPTFCKRVVLFTWV